MQATHGVKAIAALACSALLLDAAPLWAQSADGGSSHTAIVTSEGALWTWGTNGSGQVGDNTTTTRPLPVAPAGMTGIVSVAAGANHTVVAKSDGTLWRWGANGNNQLGDGTNQQRNAPIELTSLTGVTAVAAGAYHTLALTSGGTVWSWGYNVYGQLGDGTTTQRSSPVQVSGLSGVVAIGAGVSHSLALKSDGSVWAWGYNAYGQLGDNTATHRTSPVRSGTIAGITAVAGGDNHTLALGSDGTVYAWGRNSFGQLGDSSLTERRLPIVVSGLTQATSIAAGWDHSVATRQDGSVWTWGANTQAQLGNGTSTGNSTSPVSVTTLSDITHVGAGQYHTMAVSASGEVWAWGYNSPSQIGDGTQVMRTSPVKISEAGYDWKAGTPTFSPAAGTYQNVTNVTVASATPSATIRYTTSGLDPTESDAVVPANGIVTLSETTMLKAKAWKTGMPASNVDGGTYTLRVPAPSLSPWGGIYSTPQTVTVTNSVSGSTMRYTLNGLEPTESDPVIASGGTVAIDQTQTLKVKAWKSGWVTSDTTMATYTLKVAAPVLTPAGGAYGSAQTVTASTTSPGATLRHTLSAAMPSATDPVFPSGGVTVDAPSTLRVRGFRSGWTDSDMATATYQISLGVAATPALTPAGGTYTSAQTVAMASATAGALIRYTTDGTEPTLTSRPYSAPIVVSRPMTVRARAFKSGWTPSASSTDTYAFDYGTVAIPVVEPPGGDNATTRVVTITTTTPDATIRYTTDGLEPTETDLAVPANGQITVDAALRLKVKAFKTGMTPSATRTEDYWITGAVAAGHEHTLALKADGTVWSWGSGGSGRLGDGFTTQRLSPVAVAGLTDVVAIAAGLGHSLAVKRDGTCWAWGDNSSGQLGIGASPLTQLTPVQVPGLADVVAVAAGSWHSLALKRDGTVWAWGMGNAGQIGDGSTSSSNRTTPVQVVGLTGATAIAGGRYIGAALKTDGEHTGTVWIWGTSGLQGQLGDGTTSTTQRSPVAVFAGALALAAGEDHMVVAAGDGSIFGWGLNSYGQVGDGTQTIRLSAVAAGGIEGALQVAAGKENSFARTADGSIWAWGNGTRAGMHYYNAGGALKSPARIPAAGSDNAAVAANGLHAMAIRRDGSLWGWGANTSGQIGLGTTSTVVVAPTRVPNFSLVNGDWLTSDQDQDGLPTWRELALGLDPRNPDSNGDGLLDGAAVAAGLSATDTDVDGDGVSNATERAMGTDPFRADTDGDGVNDFVDAFPLDPTRWQAPLPDPGDTTPPVITLTYPATAIPIPPL